MNFKCQRCKNRVFRAYIQGKLLVCDLFYSGYSSYPPRYQTHTCYFEKDPTIRTKEHELVKLWKKTMAENEHNSSIEPVKKFNIFKIIRRKG